MSKRARDKQFKIYISHEEELMIEAKMQEFGITSKSEYAREMLTKGEVILKDYTALKELSTEINRIGININQIAKVANSTNELYEHEIKDIQETVKKIWQLQKHMLSKEM